jgi:hypothetical protein
MPTGWDVRYEPTGKSKWKSRLELRMMKFTGLLVCVGFWLRFVGPGRAYTWEVSDDNAYFSGNL